MKFKFKKMWNKMVNLVCLCCFAGILSAKARRPEPHLLVYQTKANYDSLVSVIMDKSKTKLISYPDPHKVNDQNSTPLKLHKGLLLDRRGINENVVFLRVSYKEYSQYAEVPASSELKKLILTKHPLKTLCDCGTMSDFPDKTFISKINNWIDSGILYDHCKRIL